MKNVFGQKKYKIMKKLHFVENRTDYVTSLKKNAVNDPVALLGSMQTLVRQYRNKVVKIECNMETNTLIFKSCMKTAIKL
jgi:hypothetical protein